MAEEQRLMRILAQRTQRGLKAGSDGFTTTTLLAFDIGLNTRTLRRVLDAAVCEPPRFSWRVFSPGTQAAIAPFPMEA